MIHSAASANDQTGTTESKATKLSVIAHPKKKAAAVAVPSKATRPLNSWIAFRSKLSAVALCALLIVSRLLLHDVH